MFRNFRYSSLDGSSTHIEWYRRTSFLVISGLAGILLVFIFVSHTSSRHPPSIHSPRICIMQSDDRPLSGDPAKGPFWTSTAYASAWYAIQHGYSYLRLPAPPRDGYYPTWWRLQPMLDTLKDYDYLIFLDSDSFIFQPHFSIDDLRSRWGMSDDMHFMIGEDNDEFATPDGKQMTMANGGLWFLKNTEVTRTMLKDLIGCPEEIPGCEKWKNTRYDEQSAFNYHLRSRYVYGVDYVLAPCDETYGTPDDGDCHGTIVRHRAGEGKDKLTEWVMEIMGESEFSKVRQTWLWDNSTGIVRID